LAATRVIRRLRDLQDVHTTVDPGLGSSPVDDGSGVYPLTLVTTQSDLGGILADVAEVNWRPLELAETRFTPFGQGYADPRYRLTLNNVVHTEGLVACNPPLSEDDVGVLLATYPGDCLPGATLLFGCSGNPGNNARFDVLANGLLIGGGMIDGFMRTPITFSVGAAQ
jgi:hypothetical protein